MSDTKKRHTKRATGIVVSDKMTKTIVVRVDRQIKHPIYKKYVTRSKNYKVHDEKNEAKIGDLISMIETRPLSKHKRWVMTSIVRENPQARIGVSV